MPLFQVKVPSIDLDANADASSVYKAVVCLFAGIYALDSLLEAQVATTYAHKENTRIMECSSGLVDSFTGFLAHGDKDETFGLTICAASEGLYRGLTVFHGKGQYAQFISHSDARWNVIPLDWSYPFDPGG
ncbi:hypothetical protein GOP47_0017001 [Adiantum capillus-veneris]|uniref:Uncharacterized protein n=1 Tax=Adiantum capillus-veneris TaxID=13818 RepID=A0A9D4UH79_ADICA|nr:hypothetical protein GOP47_0016194 [Adiantum capillus-veneris]KAI5068656.1 hypothetical protein GOP47_0017001 [Adiantum capillus-veneris]